MPTSKRTYLLIQDVIKTFSLNVDAESLEDAANIGMALPIEKWTDLKVKYTRLKYVGREPKGTASVKYREQKWMRSRNRWVRRKLHG